MIPIEIICPGRKITALFLSLSIFQNNVFLANTVAFFPHQWLATSYLLCKYLQLCGGPSCFFHILHKCCLQNSPQEGKNHEWTVEFSKWCFLFCTSNFIHLYVWLCVCVSYKFSFYLPWNLFPCILPHVVSAVKEKECVCVYVWRQEAEWTSIPFASGLVAFRKQPPQPSIHTHIHRALTVHPKACCVPQELKGKRLLPLSSSSNTA